ncbi:MAG: hypothetical protein ACM37W_14455 [Actinomycetota bacterium]
MPFTPAIRTQRHDGVTTLSRSSVATGMYRLKNAECQGVSESDRVLRQLSTSCQVVTKK